MRIVADENIEAAIIGELRANNYEVYAVVEQQFGITDQQVLAEANLQDSLLLTSDTDFGELVYRMKQVTSGICLLRLRNLPADEKATIVLSVLQNYGPELKGAFTVITPKTIRVRNLEGV